MALTYGVAALARPTFDVPFAEPRTDQAFAALAAAGIETVGPRELLFDRDAAEKAVAEITAAADGGRREAGQPAAGGDPARAATQRSPR